MVWCAKTFLGCPGLSINPISHHLRLLRMQGGSEGQIIEQTWPIQGLFNFVYVCCKYLKFTWSLPEMVEKRSTSQVWLWTRTKLREQQSSFFLLLQMMPAKPVMDIGRMGALALLTPDVFNPLFLIGGSECCPHPPRMSHHVSRYASSLVSNTYPHGYLEAQGNPTTN